MTDMREAVARALFNLDRASWVAKHPDDNFNLWEENCKAFQDEWRHEADAALSLMQPEIDRRVAEEKAKAADALTTLSARVETLEAALREIRGFTLYEVIRCSGDKCRMPTCADCFGEDCAYEQEREAGLVVARVDNLLNGGGNG